MSKEIIVTGCSDCPIFYYAYSGLHTCNAKKEEDYIRENKRKAFDPITPSWCPLRSESITIKLKEDGE